MRKSTGVLILIVLCAGAVSCGRRRLRPAEIERNRLFAEILKRSDRRDIGADGFFEKTLRSPAFPEGRQWAAVALGRIGDPAALPPLYRALDSADAPLRAAAAFALGEIEDRDTRQFEGRPLNPESIPRLLRHLDDTAVSVRMRAVEALGKAGAQADAAEIGRRARAMRHDRSPLGRACLAFSVTALMRLAREFPTLRDLALSDDPDIQWRAADALFRLRDRESFPVFRALLDSHDPDVQAHAALGLGICTDRAALPLLTPLLRGRTLAVRACAVRALGTLGDPAAVEPINRALAEFEDGTAPPGETNFAAEAATALGQIGSPDAAPALELLLRPPGPASDAAVVALAKVLRSEPDRFFGVAKRECFSTPPGLRAYARALGQIGGPNAVLELHSILRASFDERSGSLAIPAVLEALAQARTPDLDGIATSLLQSHDGPILRSALAAYQPPPGATSPWLPIVNAYQKISASQDAETKAALLERLEPWAATPDVARALEAALHDRSRNARIVATRLLRKAGRTISRQTPGPPRPASPTSPTASSPPTAGKGRSPPSKPSAETSRSNSSARTPP